MSFELVVLGAASATPTSNSCTTSQLLKMREHYFLIDCGEGAQKQLRRSKTKFSRINNIFISHLHGDHFFGLVGLLSSFHLLGRSSPLTIYGPPKLKEIVLTQFRAAGTFTSYPISFVITQHKVPKVLLETEAYTVTSFPLKHRIATTGFKFEEKPLKRGLNKERADEFGIPVCDYHWIKEGRDWTAEDGTVVPNDEITFDPPKPLSYAFASDTMYVPETSHYVAGTTVLYHESTFCEDKAERARQTMHSTAKEAAKVAEEAEVNHLIIGHHSARYKDFNQFENEAQEVFKPTIRARELHAYKVSDKGIQVKNLRTPMHEE
ncbi:MAG TPA: ribonuclease Z [Cryomorphaceae bacterium]|nr:ribonuclease Z [Cryomorphaceae bacterium]|tara:strand:+ start:2981 stop:3943 length:963 start_codon:yes stop_codon:yes gene_type:complete